MSIRLGRIRHRILTAYNKNKRNRLCNILKNVNIFNFDQIVFEDIIKTEVEKLVKQYMSSYEQKLAENYCFDDKLLSRKETANKLNISLRTLADKTKNGKIRSVCQGRSVKFRNSDILEYIKKLK